MNELLNKLMPNIMNYMDRFLESLSATFQMFFIAGLRRSAKGKNII